MNELELSYYFGHIEDFPFSEYLTGLMELPQYFSRKKNELLPRILSERKSPVPEQTVVKGEVYIGEGCMIDPFVLIEGPVWIGNRVMIHSGALVRAGSIIGDDVVIGHGIDVKNVHVARGAKLQVNTFVGDSIVGSEARIGSGTIIGNRRFDQMAITLDILGEKIVTGREKFGSIIGDRTRLGLNVSTSPGTVVGPDCLVYSNTSLSGFIPARSIVKLRQQIEIVERRGENFQLQSTDSEGSR